MMKRRIGTYLSRDIPPINVSHRVPESIWENGAVCKEPCCSGCVGWMHLRYSSVERRWAARTPMAVGWFMLTGRAFTRQTGHNDDRFRAGWSPGHFIIFTGSEALTLFLVKDPQTCVVYTLKLEASVNTLVLREITNRPNYVFIGHGYLQHAECW